MRFHPVKICLNFLNRNHCFQSWKVRKFLWFCISLIWLPVILQEKFNKRRINTLSKHFSKKSHLTWLIIKKIYFIFIVGLLIKSLQLVACRKFSFPILPPNGFTPPDELLCTTLDATIDLLLLRSYTRLSCTLKKWNL